MARRLEVAAAFGIEKRMSFRRSAVSFLTSKSGLKRRKTGQCGLGAPVCAVRDLFSLKPPVIGQKISV